MTDTRSEAARLMGSARTPAKAEASRANGKLGGRPPGIRAITMHPAVSRAMSPAFPSSPAIGHLVTLRKSLRDRSRAAANMADELNAFGNRPDAYDRGQIVALPEPPGKRLLLAALGSEGLPSDLHEMIIGYLAAAPSDEEIKSALAATERRAARRRNKSSC